MKVFFTHPLSRSSCPSFLSLSSFFVRFSLSPRFRHRPIPIAPSFTRHFHRRGGEDWASLACIKSAPIYASHRLLFSLLETISTRAPNENRAKIRNMCCLCASSIYSYWYKKKINICRPDRIAVHTRNSTKKSMGKSETKTTKPTLNLLLSRISIGHRAERRGTAKKSPPKKKQQPQSSLQKCATHTQNGPHKRAHKPRYVHRDRVHAKS